MVRGLLVRSVPLVPLLHAVAYKEGDEFHAAKAFFFLLYACNLYEAVALW